jgi:hypothetical protein
MLDTEDVRLAGKTGSDQRTSQTDAIGTKRTCRRGRPMSVVGVTTEVVDMQAIATGFGARVDK